MEFEMTKKVITKLGTGSMAVIASFSAGASVLAENITVTDGRANANHEATTTPNGTQAANGSITIQGATSEQSIKNKKFELFKIFNVENAEHNESVNYTFVDKYKKAVQTVVAAALNKRDGTNYRYSDVTEYMAIDYIQSLNNHQVEGATTAQTREGDYSAFRYFTEDLKNEIKAEKITGDIVTINSANSNNEATIDGLSWGYYIVDEISTGDDVTNGQNGHNADGQETDGVHYSSSLVLIDTANGSFTIKLKSDYPSITKKIKEDDNNTGYNDIGDYEIGQTIPYKYESTIPNMNGYHGYYYAMEDRLDSHLTFRADKSKIKIVISNGSKSYTVKNNEYNLSSQSNSTKALSETAIDIPTNATFYLEFENLKTLVDREFNNMNADGENDYSNLKMTVTYEGYMNETAADATGRPGFENDVRLIFSNNPDTTLNVAPKDQPHGSTPWDTVVAFTYKFNGVKVNKHNFALKDAQFKIYSDAACENEIYVKQKDNTTINTGTNTNNPNIDTKEKKGASNKSGTVGTTNNLTTGQDSSDKQTSGNNEYVVINRDQIGGTDHTGGTKPSNAVTITSDADGNFTIEGLDQGTYYLKEIKAPKGYRLLEDPIKLTITPTFTSSRNTYVKGDGATTNTLMALDASGDIREFYHEIFKTGHTDFNTDVAAGSFDVKVVNEVQSKLPITGEQGAALAIGVSVALIAVGTTLYVKHKNAEDDKNLPTD